MNAWQAIQTAVDTIENSLGASPDIEALAAAAHLSPFYFQRLFRRLVGRPVAEYARLRRLAAAAGELENTDKRVLDIALDTGFASHEALTRAFKAAFGLSPAQYRARRPALQLMQKPDLALYYVDVDEGVPLLSEGIVLEICRRTLPKDRPCAGTSRLVEQQMADIDAVGLSLPAAAWREFHEKKTALGGLIVPSEEIGASYFGAAAPGRFTYFAGATLQTGQCAPANLARWTLPAGEYIAVCIEAETQAELVEVALDRALAYLFGAWLPRRGQEVEPFSAEIYPEGQDGNKMELWVKPLQQPQNT